MVNIRKHPKFENIYISGNREKTRIYTKSLDYGKIVYGERLVDDGDDQYREWNPFRSKICATIVSRARNIYLNRNSKVLYLGAASGTTVSHISDILSGKGCVYAVEFSPRSLRQLVQNCADRSNVIPILGDANRPYEYAQFISGPVDVIIQDVAQPNQSEILIKNARRFLTPGKGRYIYAIKARSIDTAGEPQQIFVNEKQKLEENTLQTSDNVNISKYQEDHTVLFGRYIGS